MGRLQTVRLTNKVPPGNRSKFLVDLARMCKENGLIWTVALDLVRWTDAFITQKYIHRQDREKRLAAVVFHVYGLPNDLAKQYKDPSIVLDERPDCSATSPAEMHEGPHVCQYWEGHFSEKDTEYKNHECPCGYEWANPITSR